jgi:hypothetical protein
MPSDYRIRSRRTPGLSAIATSATPPAAGTPEDSHPRAECVPLAHPFGVHIENKIRIFGDQENVGSVQRLLHAVYREQS